MKAAVSLNSSTGDRRPSNDSTCPGSQASTEDWLPFLLPSTLSACSDGDASETSWEPCDVSEHGEHEIPHPGSNFLPSVPPSNLVARADTSSMLSGDKDHEPFHSQRSSRRSSVAPTVDVVRPVGTTANIVGSAAPAWHYALAPVSAVGGAVGAVAGGYQVWEGLSAPSGITDPHLVTKGSITAGVGATCMGLGLAAAAAPACFVAALGLGIVGLGAATTVDATMDGLCPHCRDYGPVKLH